MSGKAKRVMRVFRYVSLFFVFYMSSLTLSAMSSRPLYVTPSDKYHIVKQGDTLCGISRRSGISVNDLKVINNLQSDRIYVGQKIYYEPHDPVRRNLYVTERRLPPDKKHTVKRGESLTIIAKMYGLDLLELLHYNHIVKWAIEEGDVLFLAEGMLKPEPLKRETEKKPATLPKKKSSPKIKDENKIVEAKTPISKKDFASPLQDFRVSQRFNRDQRHQGIDLAAPAGTPIYASKSGTVMYSGTQTGYGNMVILEHPNRIMTVYAHNEKNIVEAGDKIKQGDQIATVGSTGRSTGNHLHFEIRSEGRAVDPQKYITELGK